MEDDLKEVSQRLAAWYVENKRALPWRGSRDPYVIWLSEVIMQQTRIEQGTPYFLKFLKQFPDVHQLAKADQDSVLKAWEGLGYYSRARNMHKAAKMVSEEMNGTFPSDQKGLLTLPGVGKYIASAIASICYDEPTPVVDGNVYRFLSRLLLIGTEINSTKAYNEFSAIGSQLLKGHEPGLINQAMMEYGARVCTYKKPSCDTCIYSDVCGALKTNRIDSLPVKRKKKASVNRYINYHVILHEEHTYINKRGEGDVWQGLHEFYGVEQALAEEPLMDMKKRTLLAVRDAKHILSHQNIYARFFVIESTSAPKSAKGMMKVKTADLGQYAFARLTTRFMEENEVFFK